MRVLFIGDIFARPGRKILREQVPDLRKSLNLDLVIANGENAAGGIGITPKIADEIFDSGVDVITLGNHGFDQKEVIPHLDKARNIVRPANYPPGTPGRGDTLFELADGRKALIINTQGRLFIEAMDDPFAVTETILKKHPLGNAVHFILMDFHAEASSEKQAYGNYFDGRASLIVGTHTHIPTADARILPKGTGFITDVGMTGVYDSIIGMDKKVPIEGFVRKFTTERKSAAKGEAMLCGVMVETDDRSGLTQKISPVRVGHGLSKILPDF